MAINVAVEIFVIKTLSILNLVIILVAQRWRQAPKSNALLATSGAILNC